MKPPRAPADPERTRTFKETARQIVHMDRVKRQFGEAVDMAGAVARAMEQAYRLGFERGLTGTPDARKAPGTSDEARDALEWSKILPRTRSTFWSICLASLGRTGRTQSASYLVVQPSRRHTPVWGLVVPDRQTFEKSVGDGTIVTLLRLGLLQHVEAEERRVTLTDYGIRTWNRFCERGGQFPDDLVDKLA